MTDRQYIQVWDQQLGKSVSGYVTEVTEFWFILRDADGKEIGKFDVDMLNLKRKDMNPDKERDLPLLKALEVKDKIIRMLEEQIFKDLTDRINDMEKQMQGVHLSDEELWKQIEQYENRKKCMGILLG